MTASDGTVLTVLADAVRQDPGRPLVTFYDEATGERVELSRATFDNWVSKVANLFSSELGVVPGSGLTVELPPHWLGPVVLVGGWAAGLTLGDDLATSDVAVVGPQTVATAATAPDVVGGGIGVVACSLRPLGGRFTETLPSGWLDFAVVVPPQPDAILLPVALDPGNPALSASTLRLDHTELLAAGRQAAGRLGLAPGDRLATDLDPTGVPTLVTSLVAPLVAGASLVLVVNATPERRAQIVEQEKVTQTVWRDDPGR